MKGTIQLASDLVEILQVRAVQSGDTVDHLIDGILREKLLIAGSVDRRRAKPFRVKPHNFGDLNSSCQKHDSFNRLNDSLQDLEILHRLQVDHVEPKA